jgi:hypothetical protein
MALAADTVADALGSDATRTATLDALEAHRAPIPSAVAFAAAPALVDIMTSTEREEQRPIFDRSGLLLGRLVDEAAPEPAPLFGAACGGSRLAALYAPSLVVGALQRAVSAAQPLTRSDARSFACLYARECPAVARGYTAPMAAAGYTMLEFFPIVSFLTGPPARLALCLVFRTDQLLLLPAATCLLPATCCTVHG